MNIRALATETGLAERQIRYLIAEGFVPPPEGGRANAEYGAEHVNAILRYMRLHDLGFPPAAIKLLLQTREGAPFPVVPGVTLVVDPNLAGSGRDPRPIVERVRAILTGVLKEYKDAPGRKKD